MIQSADVGVGINGEEGLQAARSADFSIGQFRFLKRLLLIHGRYCYRRNSIIILYTIYRNLALYLTQFWFCLFNGFSGQSLFDRWTLAQYNFFTGVPIIAFGIFDKDILEKTIFRFPRMYCQGQDNEVFNAKRFFGWILNGIFHSFVVFSVTAVMQGRGTIWTNGWNGDLYSFGHTIFTTVIITVGIKLFLETYHWTWVSHLAYWGSYAAYLVWELIYGVFWLAYSKLGETYFFLPVITGASPTYWLTVFLSVATCLARDVMWKYAQRVLSPTRVHAVQEFERRLEKRKRDIHPLVSPDHCMPVFY